MQEDFEMMVTTYKLRKSQKQWPELLKERSFRYTTERTKVNNPESVVDMMRDVFRIHENAEEYLYMLTVTPQLKLTGVFEVSHGDNTSSVVSPQAIFQRALLAGASGIILVHNHPSDDTTPSDADYNATTRIKQGGELLGIQLLDHIIIGSHSYYSFKTERFI